LPALSKATSQGLVSPVAKMLFPPSHVNLKIAPHPSKQFFAGSLPDTNKFWADALEQIKITAPKHATLPNSRLAKPMADLNLISVSLVFIVVPLFIF
jgi:hypothetical protein